MKPPRHLTITTVGRTDDGLVLNVQLRRRTIGAWRLFYRAARDRSVGRLPAALLAGRICLARAARGRGRSMRPAATTCVTCRGEGVVGICSAHQTRDDGCEICDRPMTCPECAGSGSMRGDT